MTCPAWSRVYSSLSRNSGGSKRKTRLAGELSPGQVSGCERGPPEIVLACEESRPLWSQTCAAPGELPESGAALDGRACDGRFVCALLKPDEPVILMGATGTPTETPSGETVLLVGGGLGNAVLFSIGAAFRAEKAGGSSIRFRLAG
jgi:hypothetical protein